MQTKTLLPAVLALSMLGGLAPAYATMTTPYQTPPAPASAATAKPALDQNTLAQLAMEAGITVDQAKNLTLSQLAAMKEAHDS